MRKPIVILLATLSLSAFAQNRPGQNQPGQNPQNPPRGQQPNGPCTEFDQKLNQVQQQVSNYDKELRKAEAKVQNVEDRLTARSQVLGQLTAQRDNLSNGIRGLVADQARMRQDIPRLQNESASLSNTIAIKDSQRLSYEAQSRASTSLEVKREALRSAKRLETEIAGLQSQLNAANQDLRTSSTRIAQVDQQVQQQNQQISDLNRQIDQEQRDPAISRLQQERTQALNELRDTQNGQNALAEQVAKASDNVNMCYGYIELSAKYPTALKLSKKLVKQGCAKYQVVNQGSELENEAQDELITAACR